MLSADPKVADPQPVSREDRRARVLYDGQCALCLKSVALLKRLDWFHRLTYLDARETRNLPSHEPPLAPERFLEEMHLFVPGRGTLLHGFLAFRWIAWRLPLLCLIAPLLYLPGMPVVGQRVYLWVARHRFQLVPCHGGICRVSPKSEVQSPKSGLEHPD